MYRGWDNGKENGNYKDYRAYIGIIGYMYRGYMGIMEKKMETTRIIGVI